MALIIAVMLEYLDNPAGRLHSTLDKAIRLAPNTPAMQGWAKVFGIEPSDFLHFFRHATRLLRMASEVNNLVREFPEDDPELLLENFDEIEGALAQFTITASVQMNSFTSPLNSGKGLYCLRVCSSLLHRRCPEPVIASDQRQALVDQVRDLISDVEGVDDLDRETASWLKERLHEILQKLARPDLYGTIEVEQAVETLVGGIVRKRERVASLFKSNVGGKFVAFMVALDLALNVANNALEIGEGAATPSPSPIVIEIQNEFNMQLSPPQPALPAGKSSDGAMPNC